MRTSITTTQDKVYNLQENNATDESDEASILNDSTTHRFSKKRNGMNYLKIVEKIHKL